MRERIKEHDRDIRFARSQTSAVSEHAIETGHFPVWSKVKFIDRYRFKEAIHIRFHPNNINMRTYEGTPYNDRNNNED